MAITALHLLTSVAVSESYLTWPLFRQIVARIAQLAWDPT
jgi:hypothetical protein